MVYRKEHRCPPCSYPTFLCPERCALPPARVSRAVRPRPVRAASRSRQSARQTKKYPVGFVGVACFRRGGGRAKARGPGTRCPGSPPARTQKTARRTTGARQRLKPIVARFPNLWNGRARAAPSAARTTYCVSLVRRVGTAAAAKRGALARAPRHFAWP